MTVFDVTIIGSGPSAVASLMGISDSLSICVISGEDNLQNSIACHHPKIQSVAYERRESAGIISIIPIRGFENRFVFETAIQGGLANYWGQQFVRYPSGDEWPRTVFNSFANYENACEVVESYFRLTPSTQDIGINENEMDGYIWRTPRLLVGTQDDPSSGLLAMKKVFQALTSAKEGVVVPHRAQSWRVVDDVVEISIDNSDNIYTRKLLLAAGVMGTLKLTLNSCPEVSSVQFKDSTPKMFYAIGLHPLFSKKRVDGLKHFNALSIEKVHEDDCQLFSSVYKMGYASFSLLTAAVGLPPMLRGWSAPRLANLIKPIQVWTKSSIGHVVLERGRSEAYTYSLSSDTDSVLKQFKDWLRENTTWALVTDTPPGSGFHFHGGEVMVNGSCVPLNDFFSRTYKGKVLCVDTSVLKSIGCRPNSLTGMAASYELSLQI